MNEYKYIDDVKVAREMGLATKWQRTAHIHTLNGKPLIGGSTLKSIIGDKGALMQWYADMAAVAGLAFPKTDLKAEYEVTQAIQDKRERAEAKKALDEKYPRYAEARRAAVTYRDEKAEEGTLRHGELEDYIKTCITTAEGKPLTYPLKEDVSESLKRFVRWATEFVTQFHFTEAYCYHEPLWLGGIADVGMTLKDGRRVVGDHKSSKEAYEDQFIQCAIYDVLLSHSGGLDRDGNKLFDWNPADGYVVFPFRSEPFTPEFRWNTVDFQEAVVCLKKLYKLIETIY